MAMVQETMVVKEEANFFILGVVACNLHKLY